MPKALLVKNILVKGQEIVLESQISLTSTTVLRRHNCTTVLQVLRGNGQASKVELARLTGLSMTTITKIIDSLVRQGYVRAAGMGESSGGRRPTLFEFNATRSYVAGVDIKVDNVVCLLMDLRHQVAQEVRIPIEAADDEHHVIGKVQESIQEVLRKGRVPFERLTAVGVSVPGLVDRRNGLVVFAPNLGWRNVPLTNLLATWRLPLLIENEANAAAVAELTLGSGRGAESLVYVSVNIGVGCGVILDGRLYRGFVEGAGEFGHMTIIHDGPRCQCGSRGCWEVLTSDAATARRYLSLLPNPATSAHMTIQDVVQQARAGGTAAQKALQETGRYLGVGIANIINGLNPQVVVVGGTIAEAGSLVQEPIEEEIKARAIEYSRRSTNIILSRLGDRASALGCAVMMVEEVLAGVPALCVE